jgi:hypothetical protein
VILGIDQPKVSTLMRGRLSGFSIERLLRFLLLGRDHSPRALFDEEQSRPASPIRLRRKIP